jgi:hypothetical protein
MDMLNNYRQADMSLPYQPGAAASAQVQGQVLQDRNATGGQMIDQFVPLPGSEVILGRPLRLNDVVVGIVRHQNATADLAEALRRRSEE